MSDKKALLEKIEGFLAERKESDGGYAPVEPQEMRLLNEIIQKLIELKYERDPDGDLPVEVFLTDRTRYERPLHLPIQYAHKPTEKRTELELHLLAASRYASLARWAADAVDTHQRSAQEIMESAVEQQRPLKFGGSTYVAKIPEDVTPQSVHAGLMALVVAFNKEQPIPADDFRQGQEWCAVVAAKASEQLRVKVVPRSMTAVESGGHRFFFDVPALEATMKVVLDAQGNAIQQQPKQPSARP